MGLSHSLGSIGCTSACFCPGLSLPPPQPGPLRPSQASSTGCGSKSPEEHQHGSQPSLHWRPNPSYLHLVPVMALPTSPTSYLVFVLLGHLVAPAFPVPSFTGGGSMCGWLCAAMPEDFLKNRERTRNTRTHISIEAMNCAETMFHCYFGSHGITYTKFCSSNWSPYTFLLSIWKMLSCCWPHKRWQTTRQAGGDSVWHPRDAPEGFESSEL